jgi:hypothetical protein
MAPSVPAIVESAVTIAMLTLSVEARLIAAAESAALFRGRRARRTVRDRCRGLGARVGRARFFAIHPAAFAAVRRLTNLARFARLARFASLGTLFNGWRRPTVARFGDGLHGLLGAGPAFAAPAASFARRSRLAGGCLALAALRGGLGGHSAARIARRRAALGIVAIRRVARVGGGTIGRTSPASATRWASTFSHATCGVRVIRAARARARRGPCLVLVEPNRPGECLGTMLEEIARVWLERADYDCVTG